MRASGAKAQHAQKAAAKARKPAGARAASQSKKPTTRRESLDRVLSDAALLERLTLFELAARRGTTTTGDPELDAKIAAFDRASQLQAEAQREMNVLREMMMEQRKKDDENLKAWIRMI